MFCTLIKIDSVCMIVRMASQVNVHDAGYATGEGLRYSHPEYVRPGVLPDRDSRLTDRDRKTETDRPRQIKAHSPCGRL